VARLAPLALAALALGGCAGPARVGRPAAAFGGGGDLGARLAARAAALVGERGAFRAGGERFNGDCSGFVQAVYQAEGIPLRRLMALASPRETSGAAAAYQAVRAYGIAFGGGGQWPAPGDLVFFHDTYDRDRDGRADDPFTHVGVVERVRDGTVVFLHRGGRAVARAALTPGRPDQTLAPDGTRLNSFIRDKRPPLRDGATLTGQLFAGYGRIDPARVPRDLARRAVR
jgi:antitoxin (DNA-binding transcriptional repressor) of toxin-antitoxin stability system